MAAVSSPTSLQPGPWYPQLRKVPRDLVPSSHSGEDGVVPLGQEGDPGDD